MPGGHACEPDRVSRDREGGVVVSRLTHTIDPAVFAAAVHCLDCLRDLATCVTDHYGCSSRVGRRAICMRIEVRRSVEELSSLVPSVPYFSEPIEPFNYQRNAPNLLGPMPLEFHVRAGHILKRERRRLSELELAVRKAFGAHHQLRRRIAAAQRKLEKLRCDLDSKVCAEWASHDAVAVYYGAPPRLRLVRSR